MGSAAHGDAPIPGSAAVARLAADGTSVEVRCGKPACGKLLFTLERAGDSRATSARKCRGVFENVACGLQNTGYVTDRRGKPVADSLPDPWECSRCGSRLGRIHPVKGRITVRCRCGEDFGATAAAALLAAEALARAS
jgi:hypothetical protein